MTALLLLSLVAPLALAPFVVVRGALQTLALRLAPWAAIPALATALGASVPFALDLEWLLLGTRLGVDELGRVFLFFTAVVWVASGVYARSYITDTAERSRFFLFYLLTLCGNVGLIVAQDIASFFLFFTLMTFSAYGLIIHRGGGEAIRAGRVYIGLAVLGEAMLLAGGLLAAARAPSLLMSEIAVSIAVAPDRNVTLVLLFLGFGVKAGIVPLHVWLPIAHPVAPTPASAVLSGCMIKAGLLGWLRLLPLGEATLPDWGVLLIALGFATAFFGVVAGVVQTDPKTILAYSSVSQMGIMTSAVGAGLMDAGIAPVAVGAVGAYALHHALAKGALFLGVGVVDAGWTTATGRAFVLAGTLFAALALAGAPLTSGSLAKHYILEAGHLAPQGWSQRLDRILPLTAVGTALLIARFIQRTFANYTATARDSGPTAGVWLPWLGLLLALSGTLWILPGRWAMNVEPPRYPDAGMLWAGIWPVLSGVALLLCAVALSRRTVRDASHVLIPAGDILTMAERRHGPRRGKEARAGRSAPPAIPDPWTWLAGRWYSVYAERERWAGIVQAEHALTRWGITGLLFLLGGLILLGLLYFGGTY